MKVFKIQVDESRSDFFRELLSSLNGVIFEEFDENNDARVYPAANFELRTSKEKTIEDLKQTVVNLKGSESRLGSLKEVISKIDQRRDADKR